MKKPDEIKKWLECCTHVTCNGCPYDEDGCATSQQIIDALEYIQQLEYRIGELTGKVAQLEEEQPKWISVEDRLPDAGEKVIVCGVKNGMHVGAFRGKLRPGNNRRWWWKKDTILEVTHWIPIPQMPKEDA